MTVPENQSGATGGAAEAPASPPEPQAEIERLTAELREANDRALRAQAESENYRKRMRRELEEERKYAALPLLRDLLPVVDNLERAIEAAEQAPASGGLLEGVKMVFAQMNGLFAQHACRRIEAVGQPFDPHLHEALAQMPSPEHEAGVVVREARSGYQFHERVVRPAQVFVSTGPPQ